ncbi:hypothetical protein D3C81_678150 [compost metagenome]
MAEVVLDIAKFRQLFPQFADTTKFPDVVIEMYWDQAICMMEDGCYDCLDDCSCTELQLYLLMAHMMALSITVNKGKQTGLVSSSTVDKVSVTRVTPPATDMFDYWLGQTPYGMQLLAMLQAALVGGFSIGGLPERKAFRKVGGTFQ